MNLETSACKHCGIPVAWCLSTRGRPMPIDPQPDKRGNVFVANEKGKLVGRVRFKAEPRPRGVPFMAHFATCEVLNRGRKPKEKKPCKPKPEPAASLFD